MNVNGFDLEPPDQGLCVGAGVTVGIVNLVIKVYRPNGTVVEGPNQPQYLFRRASG